MKKSLIFLPVGRELNSHPAYDFENHWRLKKENRNYEVVLCPYKDFIPELNTYDLLLDKKLGMKWILCKWFLENFNYHDYEYIGFFDDDIITDIQSVNKSLEIAKQNDLKIFQLSLSLGSKISHPVLLQKPLLSYSLTTYTECMCPFYHISIIDKIREILDYCSSSEHWRGTGWGFDCIITPALKMPSAVIHEVSMFHPPVNSTYNSVEAYNEMLSIYNEIYPKYMKDKYNVDETYVNDVKELTQIYKI